MLLPPRPQPQAGRPRQPPVGGQPQLATPLYYIVKLRDGRPGVVAAADHTRVWVPRIDPHLPVRHDAFWWDRLMTALAPKAGFVLYSEDHDTKSLDEPGRYVRRGYVYDAIDMTWLKRAMDMSMDAWTKPSLKTRETEKLINWLLRLSKNAGATYSKGKDAYGAAEIVADKLLVHPEVKAVVYSGKKTSLAQVDSMRRLLAPKGAARGGAGYKLVSNGTTSDSLWREDYYDKDGKPLGHVTARPSRR